MAPGKTPTAVRSIVPDREAWLGAFSGVFTRVVLFGIEGTSARITAVRGLSDLLIGTTVSLADQTPLRWSIEAASPIVGAGRSPSGEIMTKLLKLAAPRAFAVVPLVTGKKLAGLVYGDRGGDPLPLTAVADVFAECEKLLRPATRTKTPPPERAAFKSSARREQRVQRTPKPRVLRTKMPLLADTTPAQELEALEQHDADALTTKDSELLATIEAPTPVEVAPTVEDTTIEATTIIEAPPPLDAVLAPPEPAAHRPTVVQDVQKPWTPFADMGAGNELADAIASVSAELERAEEAHEIPALPEFSPPEEPSFTRPLLPQPPRRETLDTPIAVSKEVLERAEELVVEHTSAKRRSRWAFALAAVVGFAVSLYLFAPTGFGRPQHRIVTLPAEATPSMIGEVLQSAGLVRSAQGFAIVGELAGVGSLRAGSYSLTTNHWPWQVARELTSGGSALHDVVIESGLTVDEIAHRLSQADVVSAEAFVEAAHDAQLMARYGVPSPDAQGWLAPGPYAFANGIAADDVAAVMIERFVTNLDTIQATRDLTPSAKNDVVILASIVEKEAKDKSEAARIAGLFANRLKLGMRLESRATALYILGVDKQELTLADVRQPSPFNTYLNPGLPPAPIASPGLEALRAAAEPEPNPFYYMTDKDDGSGAHVFSQTYEEHLKAQRANR